MAKETAAAIVANSIACVPVRVAKLVVPLDVELPHCTPSPIGLFDPQDGEPPPHTPNQSGSLPGVKVAFPTDACAGHDTVLGEAVSLLVQLTVPVAPAAIVDPSLNVKPAPLFGMHFGGLLLQAQVA